MPKLSLFAFLQEIFLKMPKPIVKLRLQCFLGNVIVKRKVSKILSLKFQRLISFYLSLHTKTNTVFHDIILVRIGRLSLSHSHVVQKYNPFRRDQYFSKKLYLWEKAEKFSLSWEDFSLTNHFRALEKSWKMLADILLLESCHGIEFYCCLSFPAWKCSILDSPYVLRSLN